MSEAIRFTLNKDERLSRKKIISDLYDNGKSIKTPAVVLVFLATSLPVEYPAQVLFTVGKRNFRRAHDRNRVKRLMREAYRRQKPALYESLRQKGNQMALMFIFTGRQLPNYPYVHGRFLELLKKLGESLPDKERGDNTIRNEEN
jgi:ribonuclease P protein component